MMELFYLHDIMFSRFTFVVLCWHFQVLSTMSCVCMLKLYLFDVMLTCSSYMATWYYVLVFSTYYVCMFKLYLFYIIFTCSSYTYNVLCLYVQVILTMYCVNMLKFFMYLHHTVLTRDSSNDIILTCSSCTYMLLLWSIQIRCMRYYVENIQNFSTWYNVDTINL